MTTRRTYGYGRVSPTLTPSPYSPLHRPSQFPGTPGTPVGRAAGPRRRGPVRLAVIGLVVAIAGVVAGVVALTGKSSAPSAIARPQAAASTTAQDAESARLPRSAIAVFAYTRPRG